MIRIFSNSTFRSLLAGTALLLSGLATQAQTSQIPVGTARSYAFLTVTAVESNAKSLSKLLIAPAFNGRTEVQLEPLAAFLPSTRLEQLRHNEELLAQCLGELSAAGWELIQVVAAPQIIDKDTAITRYLLRKPQS